MQIPRGGVPADRARGQNAAVELSTCLTAHRHSSVGQLWRGCCGSQRGQKRGACQDFILEQQGRETKAAGECA